MRKTYFFVIFIFIFIFSCKKDNEKKNSDYFSKNSRFHEISNVSFKNISVNSILVDGSGYKWVGTDSGLFTFDNKNWYKYSFFNGRIINSLSAHNSDILIATSKGAYTISIENDSISILDSLNEQTIGSTSDSMSVYGFGIFDKKWIGAPSGLFYYDGSAWKWNNTIRNNLGGISDVRSMAFRYNDCFFGTYGTFLFHIYYNSNVKVDAISGASQMISAPSVPFNGELTTDTIYCVFASSDSSIWFGSKAGLTRNKGETNPDNGVFEYFLRGQRVHCVIEASDKKIWAGTENGISVKTGSEWTNYNISNGLPDNLIFCVAEDKDLTIWVGTKNGISHFANGKWINYN